MAVNYQQLQHLQKVKNMLQEHHGATQLGNISKSTSSQLYEELNKAERVVLPLERTVAQAIDFIAEVFNAESPMLQFKRFQEQVRAKNIIPFQKLPENQRIEFAKSRNVSDILQLILSPQIYYFTMNRKDFISSERAKREGISESERTAKIRQTHKNAIDAMVIDPEMVADSSLETLGIQLDPDCQNLKEIFNTMKPLKYPKEDGMGYTHNINEYKGKYIVLARQRTIFNASQPATQGEKRKEDVKGTMSVYPDVLSMIRREQYIIDNIQMKKEELEDLKTKLIGMIKEIQWNKKEYGASVVSQVQDIIEQISGATSAKIVAEKIYALEKITGRHSENDKKLLEKGINYFNKRVAELIGISSHVALHAPVLSDTMEDQRLNIERFHAQINMSIAKVNPQQQKDMFLLTFENYFLHKKASLQEPFLTFDAQIRKAFGNSYQEVEKNLKVNMLRAQAIIALQRKALAGFKLEHDLNLGKKTIEQVADELQVIQPGFRTDMTKKERDIFFDQLKDLKKINHEIIEQEIERGLDKIRTGWKDRGIKEDIAETVLQHRRKVAKAAEIYASTHYEIDGNKLQKMAYHHDDPEYKEKDYTPGEISKEEKFQREKAVMIELKEKFGGKKGQERLDLWLEFEEGKTPEAIICKQLDALDAAIQALEYEKLGYTNVQNFFPYAASKLSTPSLIKIFEILLKKQYPKLNAYVQYFILLECDGDEEIYQEVMKRLMKSEEKST